MSSLLYIINNLSLNIDNNEKYCSISAYNEDYFVNLTFNKDKNNQNNTVKNTKKAKNKNIYPFEKNKNN